MTKEELLQDRYKVIAPYPDAILSVGQIVNTYENSVAYVTAQTKVAMMDYPHIFKKLEWWEDRKESDMPEYLRFRTKYANKVFKPTGFKTGSYSQPSVTDGKYIYDLSVCTFATKEEFDNQPK